VSDKSVAVNSGFGLPSLLTVLFIGLKLTGYITWSWWWVLSPLWIGWVAFLVILALFFDVVFLAGIIASIFDK